MISMSSLKLLGLLLMTICKADPHLRKSFYFMVNNNKEMLSSTWKEAFDSCLSGDLAMITMNSSNISFLTSFLRSRDTVWLGLTRDPVNDSVWHAINTRNGEVDPEDLSQSSNWDDGQQSSHCAFLNSDSKWSSKRCDEEHKFFCSADGDVTYNNIKLSWQEARDYCENNMSVLARSAELSVGQSDGWIGLYRVGGDRWQWVGGERAQQTDWGKDEPVTYDCGAFNAVSSKWQSYPCTSLLHIVCYEDNLVVVNKNLTWEEALQHCKSLDNKKLLVVESEPGYAYVRERIYETTTDEVWTGLRFLGGQWWWANRDQVNDDGALPKCPLQKNHCGVISKTNDSRWLTMDCSEKLNFVCYKVTPSLIQNDTNEDTATM